MSPVHQRELSEGTVHRVRADLRNGPEEEALMKPQYRPGDLSHRGTHKSIRWCHDRPLPVPAEPPSRAVPCYLPYPGPLALSGTSLVKVPLSLPLLPRTVPLPAVTSTEAPVRPISGGAQEGDGGRTPGLLRRIGPNPIPLRQAVGGNGAKKR